MGQGKIPWYSHRLMHRKRVTCELHDCYFRLMTIKHAIPKILSGRLNYYINRWRQEVSEFGDQTSWWEDAGMRTCPREAEPPSPRLSSPGERERHNADGHKSGGQYVEVPFGLQLPLTHQPFRTFQIKWELYFSKRLGRSSSLCRCVYACICV